MKLVITEKNDAAQQIARLLCSVGKPKADKVPKAVKAGKAGEVSE